MREFPPRHLIDYAGRNGGITRLLGSENRLIFPLQQLYVASNAAKLFSSKSRLETTVKEYMKALSHNPSLLSSREVNAFLKHNPFDIHWNDDDLCEE